MNVRNQLQIVTLLLHQNGSKPSIKDMSSTIASAVVGTGEPCKKFMHRDGQSGFHRFRKQMKVIVHQRPGMNSEESVSDKPRKAIHHVCLESVFLQGMAPFHAVRHHMVEAAWRIETAYIGHTPIYKDMPARSRGLQLFVYVVGFETTNSTN